VNFRRVITFAAATAFLAVSLIAGVFFVRTQREYASWRAQEAANQRHLSELEEKLHDQERVLTRLRTDPDFVDRAIRQKLGYARADEYIIRFGE
jgi:cell division protein FtsB